jgi:hypothetical protein
MAKRKYDDCFLKPEITQAGEYQIFKMKGKDTRGFDWQVRLAPVTAKTYPAADLIETANADRVEMYLGGEPPNIEKVYGEMEVSIGKEKEKFVVDKPTLIYVPKGVPVSHKIVKKPEKTTFMLNFTLTPPYVAPKAKKGGK